MGQEAKGERMAVKIKSYQDLLVWQKSMNLVEPKQRAHSPLFAAGLASESEIDQKSLRSKIPRPLCGGELQSIYKITMLLPDDERFGLISQMRRAAVSAPSNIAEGFGRQARGEYRHHLSMARGSLLELETHMFVCLRLGFLKSDIIDPLLNEITELSKMLATLTSRLR